MTLHRYVDSSHKVPPLSPPSHPSFRPLLPTAEKNSESESGRGDSEVEMVSTEVELAHFLCPYHTCHTCTPSNQVSYGQIRINTIEYG
jgi:hypothetical protein